MKNLIYLVAFSFSLVFATQAEEKKITAKTNEALQAAIDTAKPGDVLYYQQLTNSTVVIKRQIKIQKDITLENRGPGSVMLDGSNKTRLFSVNKGKLKLSGFNVTNGRVSANGGAFHVKDKAELELVGTSIYDCTANAHGGAIYCGEATKLVLNNVTISHNVARIGGGLFCDNTAKPSSVVMKNVTFFENEATMSKSGREYSESFFRYTGRTEFNVEKSIIVGKAFNGNGNFKETYYSEGILHSSNASTGVDGSKPGFDLESTGLKTIADNGGLVKTVAISSSSFLASKNWGASPFNATSNGVLIAGKSKNESLFLYLGMSLMYFGIALGLLPVLKMAEFKGGALAVILVWPIGVLMLAFAKWPLQQSVEDLHNKVGH